MRFKVKKEHNSKHNREYYLNIPIEVRKLRTKIYYHPELFEVGQIV